MNDLKNLNLIAIRLLGRHSLQEIFQIVVEEANKLFSTSFGTIYLEQEGNFDRVFSTLPSAIQTKPRKNGFVYQTFKKGELHIVPLGTVTPVHPELSGLNTKFLIMIPLTYRGKTIGTLNLHSTQEKEYVEKDLEIFKMFGSMASLAISEAESYAEIQNALELRDFFIALAGHELRTPLTVISGYIHLIKNKVQSNKPIEYKWIEQLSWENERLNHLVHELLEINQIKSGKLQFDFKEHDLDAIIARSISEFNIVYPQRKIDFKKLINKEKTNLIADDKKLAQVIQGILDNAAKFSQKMSDITMSLTENGKFYIIIISDKGKGMKKEDINKVFKGFYKPSDNTKEGLGLGLFLAKYIVEKHQGKITIQSKVNSGTEVKITLPKIEHDRTKPPAKSRTKTKIKS
jgi:signal transduction histidine kinase